MRNEKYNPYDYNRYFNLPKPAPEYDPSHILTPRAGMSFAELENYRRIRREAEEAMRGQIMWNTRSGTIYPDLRSAWNGAAIDEDRIGQPDCRK